MDTLDQLYKTTKTGATQTCLITVQDDTFTVTWGQLDGKQQTKTTTCTSKNIGRSNESTPQQQALLEAKAKHQTKLDSGYSTSIEAPTTVQLPMKVQTYSKVKNNVIFPCLASPKLNGVNSLFRLEPDGTLTHWSRGGKPFPLQPHLTEHIIYALNDLKTTSVNGELYIHGAFLEDITSAVKKLNDTSPSLEFFAFEFPDLPLEFDEKQYALNGSEFSTPEIVELHTHEEIEQYHDTCVKEGYEGIVIRNANCVYEYNVRSSNAFKHKKALDAEYKILSMEIDKNGHPVFTMDNPKGTEESKKTFKVKPKGTAEEKLQIVADFDTLYKNKWYTIELESYSKYNVPLKPIGIALRECDSEGNPIV